MEHALWETVECVCRLMKSVENKLKAKGMVDERMFQKT